MHVESVESTKEAYELLDAIAESNSTSFLSALQTSQVHPGLDIRATKRMNQFFCNMATTSILRTKTCFICDGLKKFSQCTVKESEGY